MPSLKVLVPLDGSRSAARSLQYVRWLAERTPVDVRLLGVIDETQEVYAFPETEFVQQEQAFLATHLQRETAKLDQVPNLTYSTSVVHGVPASRIVAEASVVTAELIVISTRGRGANTWRWGRVADKLIRSAHCNTLVIGGDLQAPAAIMVALDGSQRAEAALGPARELALTMGCSLNLVRVVSIPAMTEDSGYVIDKLFDAAAAYLDSIAPEGASTHVLAGVPEEALADFATTNAMSLIVVTESGRGSPDGRILGSVTDRLVGGATPVLVIVGEA